MVIVPLLQVNPQAWHWVSCGSRSLRLSLRDSFGAATGTRVGAAGGAVGTRVGEAGVSGAAGGAGAAGRTGILILRKDGCGKC